MPAVEPGKASVKLVEVGLDRRRVKGHRESLATFMRMIGKRRGAGDDSWAGIREA